VVALIDGQGAGPLQVFSSEPLSVSSRTFNQAPAGTFGQSLDGVTASGGLQSGESGVLMQLREDPAARSNIGVVNLWRRAAEVEVALYDGSSLPIASFTRTVPALTTIQINRPFRDIGGRSDIASGYAVISVLSGQDVYAYASVVDNGTDDPTTVPMKRGPGSTELLVAAAAATAGAHGSLWRTDLSLLNRSGGLATTEIRYRGDDGVTGTLTLAIGSGEQRIIEDVVSAAGATGGGWIEIVSDQAIHVLSRTFNLGDEGSYGQSLDGIATSATATAGQVVWLPQLAQNELFRTNIGLVNGSQAEARVRLRLFDAGGQELAARSYALDPVARRQLQEPFSRFAGRDDLEACYASVEVEAGEGVIAYASVIDNVTNDPTTMPMRF
jgi:hypothetical protein